jgi:hypothetical protein
MISIVLVILHYQKNVVAQLLKKILWIALESGNAGQNHLYAALLPTTLAADSV